ncbi:MAG: efflux RND transporter periplasmic adaptor subunit [Arachidicoccus sp.]|nr:efflux RND transporter periplasmic adaptor subunit [Arachidicoccus sp.]
MKYFLIILFGSVIFLSCSNEQKSKQPSSTSVEQKVVKTTPIVKGGLSIISKLPAQFAAYQEVSIFPKVNGYVKNVLVDIGSKVSAGQLLMTLEAPELEQASASAKAEFEKAKSDYEINKENYNRLFEASQTEGAVSAMDLALDKSKVASSLAMMNAAQANWQQQETMINYLQVHAPFPGVITARNVHPGALVSNSIKDVPMLELKQETHLRLQVDVPENIAANLKKGDSVAFIIPSLDNKEMRGIISRIADNINPQFRSERVELDVINDGTLSSGMYADVTIRTTPTPNVFHVALSAIHGVAEDKYINIRRNDETIKTPITVYKQSSDSVEIKGDFNVTDSIEVN